jgi:hypothetical protein
MYNPAQQQQSPSGYTFAASVADALLYQFKEYARFAVVSITDVDISLKLVFILVFPR